MKKRILSFIITIAICISVVIMPSHTAYAASNEAYQGIFMKDNTFIAIVLSGYVELGEPTGCIYHISKPQWSGSGVIDYEIYGNIGEIYKSNDKYYIRSNLVSGELIFDNNTIIISDVSNFQGEYVQVSNYGANMSPDMIWLNTSEQELQKTYNERDILLKYCDVFNNLEYDKYVLYDIDKNAFPELIVSKGLNTKFAKCHIYTYLNNKIVDLGMHHIGYGIYGIDDNGIVIASGGTGVLVYNRVYIKNNVIKEDETTYLSLCVQPGFEEYTYKGEKISGEQFSRKEKELMQLEFNDVYKLQNIIQVILNGTELSFDQPPILDPAGRVLVPIRKIAEAMGDDVDWNQELQTAFVKHKERALIIPLYTDHLYIAYSNLPVEWKKYSLDVPSQEQKGRTLTPVRAFCESLGATVDWDENTQTVYIDYKGNSAYKSLTKENIDEINMAYSIMREHNNVSFEPYTAEINAFLEGRNSFADSVAMGWGRNLFDGLTKVTSGQDTTRDAIKVSLSQIINILLEKDKNDSGEEALEGIAYTKSGVETLNTLNNLIEKDLGKNKNNLIINSKEDLELLSNDVPQLKALSKHIDTFEFFAVSAQELCYMLANYSNNIDYLNRIESYLVDADVKDEDIYGAINEMRDEYTKTWIHAAKRAYSEGVDFTISYFADAATLGIFSIATFAKALTNEIIGLKTSAEGLYMFYGTCCLNPAFDYTYQKMCGEVWKKDFSASSTIKMYDIQKAIKETAYISMNMIANSNDKISWNDRINILKNKTYILW